MNKVKYFAVMLEQGSIYSTELKTEQNQNGPSNVKDFINIFGHRHFIYTVAWYLDSLDM